MAKSRKGATRHAELSVAEAPRFGRLRALLPLLLLLGLALWGTERLLDPQTLPVTTVRVENELKRIGQDEVRRAVLPHVKEGFLRVNMAAIRSELESLPWVERASVRRSWPDVLVVRISEQQAIARWNSGGLLNRRGEIFGKDKGEQWSSLPLLQGPQETQRVLMDEYQALQRLLGPLDLRISRLTLDQRRAWSLTLQNGMQVRLGRNDSRKRLTRFVRVYSRILKPRQDNIDSVDLRYTNGFAVRWRDSQSATV